MRSADRPSARSALAFRTELHCEQQRNLILDLARPWRRPSLFGSTLRAAVTVERQPLEHARPIERSKLEKRALDGARKIRPARRLDRAGRAVPLLLGILTLGLVGLLLFWDAFPRLFPARAHAILGALPLALIAVAYLAYQFVRRPLRMELVKAAMLAAAFLLWSANQLWPDFWAATLFNDLAIALFVLDVFLVIAGWPATVPDESFAETQVSQIESGRAPAGQLRT